MLFKDIEESLQETLDNFSPTPNTLRYFETEAPGNMIYDPVCFWLACFPTPPLISSLNLYDYACNPDGIPSLLESVGASLHYLNITHRRCAIFDMFPKLL